MPANQEIERKFLLDSLPSQLGQAESSQLRQGYLSVEDAEVRLRQSDDRYTLTCKRGDGLVRDEAEIDVSQSQFETLWPLTSGRRLEKTRYRLPYQGLLIEIDVYHGILKPLRVAEIEFPDRESSDAFIPPDYFAREVTDDSRYKNRSLCQFGVPN
ncbi:CYTH domain-containing protein [Pelagicoccus sp. SDUM812003]|uniref:CYTH domain-containing protein n=1 Tax=Pelagicoccus sp. SDUM812003 TaxID=3041267 RepID=UPI00280C44FB|nr:CYTH domain-containing protein [Pelagicoccus sp. SDUM812003]MDQ8203814.1 CYTH domain-containing protein [Pelagicoccus sp. SDUM812003]